MKWSQRSDHVATSTILPITGYRDDPVPNQFRRAEGEIDHLAILLPGIGYNLDMPLFYYAEHHLIRQSWDVLRVEYAYNKRPEFQSLPAQDRARWLLTDVTAAYRAGRSQRDYAGFALIGKSLGTLAMGHLLTMEEPPQPVRAVWLTPLLGQERLRQQVIQYGGPSLFVIGTADAHYDAATLDEVRAATNGEAVVIAGAEHGMEIESDPVASVRALERIVEAPVRFLT
jgi:predicted alpha/beta-hydrolase family hydrolase